MIAGCYDLHLYCDGVDCTAGDFGYPAEGEFTGDETGSRARARARRRGWKLLRDGSCLCPVCNKAKRPITTDDPPKNKRGLAGFAQEVAVQAAVDAALGEVARQQGGIAEPIGTEARGAGIAAGRIRRPDIRRLGRSR